MAAAGPGPELLTTGGPNLVSAAPSQYVGHTHDDIEIDRIDVRPHCITISGQLHHPHLHASIINYNHIRYAHLELSH